IAGKHTSQLIPCATYHGERDLFPKAGFSLVPRTPLYRAVRGWSPPRRRGTGGKRRANRVRLSRAPSPCQTEAGKKTGTQTQCSPVPDHPGGRATLPADDLVG